MKGLCTHFNTLALGFLLATSGVACQARTSGAEQPNAALQMLVDGKALEGVLPGTQMAQAERARLGDQVRRFYKDQNYQLIWIDGDRPSDRYRQLLTVLDAADEHGLPADLYKVPVGAADRTTISPEHAPQLDVQATACFFRYAMHLTAGRLDPHSIEPLWTLRPEKPELVSVLANAVKNDDLADALDRLQPSQPEYHDLQKSLVRYRAIAAKGGWPIVRAGQLKPGQRAPSIPAVRQRLAIEGDLDPSQERNASPLFDATLADAVKRFEERHRLKPDGIVDAETIQAMNVPVEQRIRTLELNMERWRWLPDKMPARYILVNVPDFRLEAVENDQSVMDMRVVVGEPENKTPIFADEMTHVVFSPYWNVPPKIARNETIPLAASQPDYLDRNNMEVVDKSGQVLDANDVDWSNAEGLRIRQRPGTGNALGGVKFIFPNSFDVYLHDTNAGALFSRVERALSHGCVRVEQPDALAQYVLRDQPEWTPDAIQLAMQAGDEKHVKLRTAIPVFIVYNTAWVHEGGVRFLKDLYGHDADQSARLWPAHVSQQTRR